jgi:hypothetical protein
MHTDDDHSAHMLATQVGQGVPGSTLRFSDTAGPGAQDDPRLEGQLAILRSRRLSQFAMAINGIRLEFWGEEASSKSREIYIEHPTVGITSNSRPGEVHDWNDPAVSTALLKCLGATLSDITMTGGRLALTFANGFAVSVDPDDHYESWQINSEDGLLIVCTPGGDLTIWYPSER